MLIQFAITDLITARSVHFRTIRFREIDEAPALNLRVCGMGASWEGEMADRDGWGTARMMIEIYGQDARSEARKRSEEALQRDDMLGFERWTYLASVIGGLLAKNSAGLPKRSPLH